MTYTDRGADAAIAERNARVDVHLASVHIEPGTRPRVADAVRTWVDRVTTSKAKLTAHTWTAADSNALAARERVVEVVCR